MFEGAVDEKRRLLLHPLNDSMGYAIVGLGAGLACRNAVFIVHVLLGRPGCVFDVVKKKNGAFKTSPVLKKRFCYS